MICCRDIRKLSVFARLFGSNFCIVPGGNASTICRSTVSFSSEKGENKKMDKLEVNPYFEKYAKKIAEVQRTSPQEFLSRLELLKKPPSKGDPISKDRGFSGLASPKPKEASRASFLKDQTLESVMKIDLIHDKSADDISKLWVEYHQTQEKIAAVIPTNAYNKIFERSVECPTFLYPLPRDQGFEFLVAQFDGHSCHFTSLINYQAFKEDAPECLTIHHFTELQHDKGIVLMRGEYNKDVLSGIDALCLANQLKLYYTASPGESKHELLSTFTRSPGSFKHMTLINELQNIAI